MEISKRQQNLLKLEQDKVIGTIQGKLRVLDVKLIEGRRGFYYTVQCDCGTVEEKAKGHFKHRVYTECFKCSYEKREHVESKFTRLYELYLRTVYNSMIARCTLPKTTNFHRYGGRGIIVCKEWLNDFNSFYEWAMASGFKKGREIDRINNDGNYEASNCRWVTRKQQVNNKTTTPCNKTNNLPMYITLNPSYGAKYKVQCKGVYLGCYENLDEAIYVSDLFVKGYNHALGI